MTTPQELRDWRWPSVMFLIGTTLAILFFVVGSYWFTAAFLTFMLAGSVLAEAPLREGRLGDFARKMKTRIVGQAMFVIWMLVIFLGGGIRLLETAGVW